MHTRRSSVQALFLGGELAIQVLDGVTFNSDSLGTLFWGLVNGEVLVGFCFCPNNQPVLPTLLPEKRLSSLLESGPGLLTCQAVFLPPLHPESLVDIFMTQFPSRIRFTRDYVCLFTVDVLSRARRFLERMSERCVVISGRTRLFSSKLICQDILPYAWLFFIPRMILSILGKSL